jgi:hypothetical protein
MGKGKQLNELWQEAKKGSGWTGADGDAFAVLCSGPKGVAIIPQGDHDAIKRLADGFSVIAQAGSSDIKIVEVDEVEVYDVTENRYMISGGGISIAVTTRDNETVRRFLDGRIAKRRKLKLTLSLSDFHK